MLVLPVCVDYVQLFRLKFMIDVLLFSDVSVVVTESSVTILANFRADLSN